MTHNFSCSRVMPLAALTNRSISAAVSGAFSILLVMPSNQFGVVSSPSEIRFKIIKFGSLRPET
jgi:hypothetical protein